MRARSRGPGAGLARESTPRPSRTRPRARRVPKTPLAPGFVFALQGLRRLLSRSAIVARISQSGLYGGYHHPDCCGVWTEGIVQTPRSSQKSVRARPIETQIFTWHPMTAWYVPTVGGGRHVDHSNRFVVRLCRSCRHGRRWASRRAAGLLGRSEREADILQERGRLPRDQSDLDRERGPRHRHDGHHELEHFRVESPPESTGWKTRGRPDHQTLLFLRQLLLLHHSIRLVHLRVRHRHRARRGQGYLCRRWQRVLRHSDGHLGHHLRAG